MGTHLRPLGKVLAVEHGKVESGQRMVAKIMRLATRMPILGRESEDGKATRARAKVKASVAMVAMKARGLRMTLHEMQVMATRAIHLRQSLGRQPRIVSVTARAEARAKKGKTKRMERRILKVKILREKAKENQRARRAKMSASQKRKRATWRIGL